MKILLFQFTRNKKKAELNLKAFKSTFLKFNLDPELISLPAVDYEPSKDEFKKYDRIIFSGSEFSFEGKNETEEVRRTAREIAERFKDFVFKLKEHSTPSLAICFGHQLWAYLHNSKVAQIEEMGKAGTFKVFLTDEGKTSPILKNLQSEFYAGYMHQDAACAKPKKARILAQGHRCKYAMLDYGNNSLTTQFHPEFSKEALQKRKELYPKYFENQIEPQSDFKDTSEAQKILRNFIIEL